jgi:hypothetical protein
METLLKQPEIIRDENGRFDRHGKTLAKTAKKVRATKANSKKGQYSRIDNIPIEKRSIGRPPGALNRTTMALREAILLAGERAGGKRGLAGYLQRLATENSSAYASLLKSVLPTTLSADESSGGLGLQLTFRRVLVYPGGREEIEGVTPKALPAPDSTQQACDIPDKDVIDQ